MDFVSNFENCSLYEWNYPLYEQSTASFTLIETEEQVFAFMDKIQQEQNNVSAGIVSDGTKQDDNSDLVIGVDCEGISRQRPLALIQVTSHI